jgi:hypothetical protein
MRPAGVQSESRARYRRPVELRVSGRPVTHRLPEVPRPPRGLLTEPGHSFTGRESIEAPWGARQPAKPRRALHGWVSRTRAIPVAVGRNDLVQLIALPDGSRCMTCFTRTPANTWRHRTRRSTRRPPIAGCSADRDRPRSRRHRLHRVRPVDPQVAVAAPGPPRGAFRVGPSVRRATGRETVRLTNQPDNAWQASPPSSLGSAASACFWS